MDIPRFPDVTCGHAQVCLVMESELRGPGQVHIGLRVAPREHGEGAAGELGGGETQQQHESLLEHIKSEAEKLALKNEILCQIEGIAEQKRQRLSDPKHQ